MNAAATPPAAPDEGTVAALRCPLCLHSFGPQPWAIASPFARFPEDLRCLECGRVVPAGTRMLVGGSRIADDPNESGWVRRKAPALRVLGLLAAAPALVLAALIVWDVSVQVVTPWVVQWLRTRGFPELIVRGGGRVFLVSGVAFAGVLAYGGSICLWKALRDNLLPMIRGGKPGREGHPARSTWLVESAGPAGPGGVSILALRDERHVSEPLRPLPIACRATASPVIDDEGERGIAVQLQALVPPPLAEPPQPHLSMTGLRQIRLPGRRWGPLPSPPPPTTAKAAKPPDLTSEAWRPELRLRVEERPTTDAALVAAAAGLAACGLDAEVRETIAGRVELPEDRRLRRLRSYASFLAGLVMFPALAGLLACGTLFLVTGSSSWLGGLGISFAVAVAAVTAVGVVQNHSGWQDWDMMMDTAVSARWIAVPGAICGTVEREDRERARVLVVPVPTIDSINLTIEAEEVPEGTWLTLAWARGDWRERSLPVLELLVDLPPDEARAAGERLLAAARAPAVSGSAGG